MKPAVLGHLKPFSRIVFTVLLLITGMIITLGLGILLAIPLFHVNLVNDLTALTDVNNPAAVALMKYLQIVQAIGIFIIPPLLAGFLFENNFMGWLGLKESPGGRNLVIVILLMACSIPFINWIVTVNESMKLPTFLSGIEQWIRETEDEASELTVAFLDVRTLGGFLVNLFMIAILPAFGEELLFRGLLQKLFSSWFKNIHAAILFTAFVFAVVHLQFYGLLPRMILGMIFGYLYYWTGSLWVPVIAHFLNNGTVVVLSYFANLGIVKSSYENFGNTNNFFLIAGSLLLTLFFMGFIYWKEKQLKNIPVSGENHEEPE